MLLLVYVFLQFTLMCVSIESADTFPNLSLRYLHTLRRLSVEDKSNSSDDYELRIIGGEDTDIFEVPYQVSLQYFQSHFCGGAVATAKHIVTAAHCTDDKNSTNLSVRAGSTHRDTGGVVVAAKSAIMHPEYDKKAVDYDIAVVVLDGFLPYNEFIQPIALASPDAKWDKDTPAITSGWGLLDEKDSDSMAPRHLKAVVLYVIDMYSCQYTYGTLMIKVSERMLCVGSADGMKDTCKGDSGGPLVINGVLAGVVSFGYGCARVGVPGVYTSVPAVRSFIDDVIFDNNANDV